MIEIGAQAPGFSLSNQDGVYVSLERLSGQWVLLYWFPMADTPGCTAQAEGLRDQQEAFDEIGCRVLGASFDDVQALAAFHHKYRLTFDLLSDPERLIGIAYGVAGEGGTESHAARMSFLIDPQGIVRHIYEVEDPTFHAEDVLDDLDLFAG